MAMWGPLSDGMEAAGGAALRAPPALASEAEDPLLLLALPPPSSLCRFIPQPQHFVGTNSKHRAAANSVAARASKQQPKPIGIAFDSPGAAALMRLSPSLLPDFLRRHFVPTEAQVATEKQQLATPLGDVATVRECAQHSTYRACVSELSPLSVVLLLSLVARLRQRQQQQQQQQVIGSCLLYVQRLVTPPPQSLLHQMHGGRPFVCFCCSRRFSTSAAKLLHLERHMRRRMRQQQQQHQQTGGRHSTAPRTRAPAAAAVRQPWAGVSSWIAAASSPSGGESAPQAEASFFDTADTYAGLKQRMATAMHALTSLAKAEARHQEALGPLEGPGGGQPVGHPGVSQVQRRFPSWLPPFVAAQLEDPTASDSAAAPAVAAQRGSAAAGTLEAAGGEGPTSPEAAGPAPGRTVASVGEEEQQPADIASIAADAAQQIEQHELSLWEWCLAAANFEDYKLELPRSSRGALSLYEDPSDATTGAKAGPLSGGPQCISATPHEWTGALLRLAASMPSQAASVAIAAPGGDTGEAASEETERMLHAVRQCAAAAAGAAAAAAAVSPARILMQEAERFRRCYLCGCGFAVRLDEQQQQFYMRDAVVVMLQQHHHQQQLAAAIVAAIAPAVRCAAAHMLSSSNTNMQADGEQEQEATIRLVGLSAAAAEIAAAPLLRLAAVRPMDAFDDNGRQQQREQQQQPKYIQLSSRIGTQPAALSVALDLEAVLLQQTGEGTAAAAVAAAAAAGGRAAGAADAAAAEAAYRSLVSMEMADGELEPLQQEMLALLRQQLPDRKQRAASAAPTRHQKGNILKQGEGGFAGAAVGDNPTAERMLPTDVVYVHCDCYVQHLQQQGSFFRLLLLLLCCSGTQRSEQALRAVGQLVLQQLQHQHCNKRKHETVHPLPEKKTQPEQKKQDANAVAVPLHLSVSVPTGRRPRKRF